MNTQKSIQQIAMPQTKPEPPTVEPKSLSIPRKNGPEYTTLTSLKAAYAEKGSERSSSLNKYTASNAASKLEKLQQSYDPRKKKDSAGFVHQGQTAGGKRPKVVEIDNMDGNFVVPDVFMKTNYGSTAQYNYNIKLQDINEQELLLKKS